MTVLTYYALIGAAITVAKGLLTLAVGWYLGTCIVRAHYWRRYVRLFHRHKDPEARALEILALCEKQDADDTDALLRRGFKAAKRYDWLTKGFL